MKSLLEAVAPGSMMLFGEHAVLRGHPALVCAVDRCIRVRLTPLPSPALRIRSAIGDYKGALLKPAPDPRFAFVLSAVARHAGRLPGGLLLEIESDMPKAIGLGSSAAVTVALLAALAAWMEAPLSPPDLLREARAVITQVQGLGSGADAAASVHGGIVVYRADPPEAEPLALTHPLTAVFSGYKTPTAEVVRRVNAAAEAQPEIFAALFEAIGRVTAAAADAFRAGRPDAIGLLMTPAQGLMDAIGVSDRRLSELIHRLREQPGVSGAKISGSGLGDCVIGWGAAAADGIGGEPVPLAMAERGVFIR